MQKFSKYLPFALFAAFLMLGLSAFFQSKPTAKDARVYKAVQQYSPYYLEKRFGGLEIRNKTDPEFKEKPDNMTLFKEFEHLEYKWGKKHLRLEGMTLLILDDNGTVQSKLPLKDKKELDFVRHYYGVKS